MSNVCSVECACNMSEVRLGKLGHGKRACHAFPEPGDMASSGLKRPEPVNGVSTGELAMINTTRAVRSL